MFMKRSYPFVQVDVFSATPYRGNPLAVVLDASSNIVWLPSNAVWHCSLSAQHGRESIVT